MNRISLIDAGGTISSVAAADGVLTGGAVAAGLGAFLDDDWRARTDERLVYRGLSEDLGFDDVERILGAIREAQADDEVAGIVVAHGTDMLEEVAFLASLMRSGSKPVIFTGAQRAPADQGFDGVPNLRHAVHLAGSEQARDIGVALVFAGRVLDAQRLRKVNSAAPDAFGPDEAVLGYVDDLGPRIHATPVKRLTLEAVRPEPAVAIVPVGLAAGAETLAMLAQPPMRGIVLEAPGRGNAPAAIIEATARAVEAGIVILLVSATSAGGVAPFYESGARLSRRARLPRRTSMQGRRGCCWPVRSAADERRRRRRRWSARIWQAGSAQRSSP